MGTFDASATRSSRPSTALDRLTATLAAQTDVIDRALHDDSTGARRAHPRTPQLTTALDKLRTFSDTATASSTTPRTIWSTTCTTSNRPWALADVGPTWTRCWPTCRSSRSARTSSTAASGATTSTSSPSSTSPSPGSSASCSSAPAGATRTRAGARAGEPYYLNHTYDPSASAVGAAAGRPAHLPRRGTRLHCSRPSASPQPIAPPDQPATSRAAALMLTRFVRIQLIIFTIAVGHRDGRDGRSSTCRRPRCWASAASQSRSNCPTPVASTASATSPTAASRSARSPTSVGPTGRRVRRHAVAGHFAENPADLHADVRSVSAVGEQYVDLRPRTDAPPYLHDGSVIADARHHDPAAGRADARPAQRAGRAASPRTNSATYSTNPSRLQRRRLRLRLTARLRRDADPRLPTASPIAPARSFDDSAPLLRLPGRHHRRDPDLGAQPRRRHRPARHQTTRSCAPCCTTGPGFANEVSRLLDQTQADAAGAAGQPHHHRPDRRHLQPVDRTTAGPAAALHRGRLSPSAPTTTRPEWRPGDFALIDRRPAGLHRRLPAAVAVALTRRHHRHRHPRRPVLQAAAGLADRACAAHATTRAWAIPANAPPPCEICDSDKPYEPLAMRQHALGPYPLDPNLFAQGIPPDDRTTLSEHIFAPVEGTPLPPGAPGPRGTPPGPPDPSALNQPPTVPTALPPTAAPAPGSPTAAPSAFDNRDAGASPSVAAVHYDPRTGRYVAPDGQMFRQSDLAQSTAPKTWRDMLTSAG